MTKRNDKQAAGGPAVRRLHLRDDGQDFLHFDIDADCKIIETGPFQGWMWNGKQIDPSTVKRGVAPRLSPMAHSPDGWMTLRYPIRRIERLTHKSAVAS